MRAYEFIKEEKVDEIAPFLAAIGGALARGATMAGGALARGASSLGGALARGAQAGARAVVPALKQAGQTALNTAARTVGSTVGTAVGTNISNKITGNNQQQTPQRPGPVKVPPGVSMEIVPSNNANKLKLKLDGTELDLDMTKPANQQAMQKLGAVTGQ